MKKKALMVVSGPYRLMQAFWIVLAYPDYEWSLAILRYSYLKDEMTTSKKLAEKSRMFTEIHLVEDSALFTGIFSRAKVFLHMFLYYILGRRKEYCRNFIEEKIGFFDYDLVCIGGAFSFFEGAVLNFSKEIPIIVMQEGMSDYSYGNQSYDIITKIAGKLLFWMGYVNYLGFKPYKPFENCIKYATDPSRLTDKYKKVLKLFDDKLVDEKVYLDLLDKIYDVDEKMDYDIVVFTTPTFSVEKDTDCKKLEKYINENYCGKNVLIKKHPRDIYDYEFKGLNVKYANANIPGEVIIQSLKKSKLIFAYASTLMLSVVYDSEFNYQVIQYENGMPAVYYSNFAQDIKTLEIDSTHIIKIQ